nr:MAG TPA: hypothetical protein [Caudoviricetes sp.]
MWLFICFSFLYLLFYYFSLQVFFSFWICFIPFSGVGSSSGATPLISIIVSLTFSPILKCVLFACTSI